MPDLNEELLRRRMQGIQLAPSPVPEQQPAWRRPMDWGGPVEATPTPAPQQAVVPMPQRPIIAPTPAQQRLSELAAAPPSLQEGQPGYRREYAHPGKLNRIAAIMSGLGAGIQQGGAAGYQTAQAVRLAPYSRAVGEYQRQLEALDPLIKAQIQQQQIGREWYQSDIASYSAQIRAIRDENTLQVELGRLQNEAAYHESQRAHWTNQDIAADANRKQRMQIVQDQINAAQRRTETTQVSEAARTAEVQRQENIREGRRESAAMEREQYRVAHPGAAATRPLLPAQEAQHRVLMAQDYVQDYPQDKKFFDLEGTTGRWYLGTKDQPPTYRLKTEDQISTRDLPRYRLVRAEFEKRLGLPAKVERVE